MKQLALLCLMWLGIEDHALCKDLEFLYPRHVSMEYRDYEAFAALYGRDKVSYRDPYLFPLDEEMTYGLGLNIDFDLVRYKDYRLLWNNDFWFDSAASHVRHVGWGFELGLNYKEYLEVGMQHMSRHILEETRPMRFPTRDRLYIKFILVDDSRK